MTFVLPDVRRDEDDLPLDLCPTPGCDLVLYDDGISMRCPMDGPMFVSEEAERWGFRPLEGDGVSLLHGEGPE